MTLSVLKTICVFVALTLIACGGGNSDVRDSARESLGVNGTETAPVTPASNTTMTAPPAGVQHYICPKGCAGSGGPSAGTCPTCGSEYQHNQAYHAAQTQTPPTNGTVTTTGETTPDGRSIEKISFPGQTTTTPAATPPTPEPAQNAAGVWHYTCPKGCAGGAGSAVACAKCGTTLAHNTTYHQ